MALYAVRMKALETVSESGNVGDFRFPVRFAAVFVNPGANDADGESALDLSRLRSDFNAVMVKKANQPLQLDIAVRNGQTRLALLRPDVLSG